MLPEELELLATLELVDELDEAVLEELEEPDELLLPG